MRKLLLLLLLLIPAPMYATDYYASTSGSGSTCSSGSRCTLATAIGKLSGGGSDRVILGNGTYATSITSIPSGASDGSRNIVIAENNQQAILTGCSSNSYVIEINNKDYITIDGLVLNAAACDLAGITIGDDAGGLGGVGSTYITIQNSEVKNSDLFTCIAFHNSPSTVLSHHITIKDNIVHDCGTTNPTIDGSDGHGIYTPIHDSIIDGNTVYNVGNATDGGEAIHQYHNGFTGMDSNIYRNNLVYDNYGDCIGVRAGTDDLVYNNICYNNGLKAEGSGGILIGTDAINAGVYNNTVTGNNDVGIVVLDGSASGTLIKNNIIWNNSSPITDSGTSTTKTFNLCNSGCAVNSDPLFTNAASHDYTLTASSPAIDAGTNLTSVFTDDFAGNIRPSNVTYDIGAYERSSATPPAPSRQMFIPSRMR